MGYDLKLNDKHEKLFSTVDSQYKILRKQIGREIFSTCRIYLEDDETGEVDYYTARKIYNSIFDDGFVNLKRSLSMSGAIMINEFMEREYSKILELQTENKSLKRQLETYKILAEINS